MLKRDGRLDSTCGSEPERSRVPKDAVHTSAINLVLEALGGSVIYEELKGDFRRARQTAEASLEDARRREDSIEFADATLALGLVDLLQGEASAALAHFASIEELAPEDPVSHLRASAYANLTLLLRFNTFPNGSGADGTEIIARRAGFLAQVTEFGQRIQRLCSQVTEPAVHLETALVHGLLANVPVVRAILDQTGYLSANQLDRAANIALQPPLVFASQAGMLGGSSLLGYANLVAAGLCRRAGRREEARLFLDRAEGEYRQKGDLAGAALCLMTQGDWLAAPFSMPLAWNFAVRDGGQQGSDLAWTLEALEADRSGLDADGARAAYLEAEALFARAGMVRGLGAVQLRYGYLAHLDGHYTAATEHARKARDEFGTRGDRLGHWLACAHHALSRIGAGQVPQERDVAQAIGEWGATQGSFSYALGLGILFSRAGRHWLMRVGDYERALASYRLAQTLHEGLGALTNVAQSLVDQAGVHRAAGDTAAALTLYESALQRYEEVIGLLPYVDVAQELRLRAVLLALDICALYTRAIDPDGMARTATRIRILLDQLPEAPADVAVGLQASVANVEELLAGKTAELQSSGLVRWTTLQCGRSVVEAAEVQVPLYRALRIEENGEKGAEELFAAALAAAQRAGVDQRSRLEAEVLLQQRKYDEAVRAFRSYLDQGGSSAGWAGAAIDQIVRSGGAAGRAEGRIQEQRNHELATIFFARAQAYTEAKAHLEHLEQVSGREWWIGGDFPWETLALYGDVYAGLGKPIEALASYERAVMELEARRRRLSRDELKTALAGSRGPQDLYFRATRTAVDLQLDAERAGDVTQARRYAVQAFHHAESGKARGLLDLMAGGAAPARVPEAENRAMRSWREATARLTAWRGVLARQLIQPTTAAEREHLKGQIEVAEGELQRVEAELAEANPAFSRMINPQAEVMSLDEVGDTLPPDTALLQYYFLGDTLLAWALTHGGLVRTHRVRVDAKALRRQIRDLLRACREQAPFAELAADIAEMLLSPFGKEIERNSRLIVVPYGAAHLLPFHVLPWKGEPLVATRTVSYLPSVSTLRLLHRTNCIPSSERLLAVGNPVRMAYRPPLGGEPIQQDELPWADVEAAYVATLFPGGTALRGAAATKAAVRGELYAYPLLHFATHGVLLEEMPLLSSLLLAEGEALSLYELLGLRLDADLVVLSACDTGRGAVTGGDEVFGLTRGLLAAGARAAIVSLWPVNDASTSFLMGHLYQRIREGDSPAVALQRAQNDLRTMSTKGIRVELNELKTRLQGIEVPRPAERVDDKKRNLRHAGPRFPRSAARNAALEDYSHPFYWAPFVFVGDSNMDS